MINMPVPKIEIAKMKMKNKPISCTYEYITENVIYYCSVVFLFSLRLLPCCALLTRKIALNTSSYSIIHHAEVVGDKEGFYANLAAFENPSPSTKDNS